MCSIALKNKTVYQLAFFQGMMVLLYFYHKKTFAVKTIQSMHH